jgi:hypothetical protein
VQCYFELFQPFSWRWWRVAPPSQSRVRLVREQNIALAYVVRERFRGDRSGALVIKSGVYTQPVRPVDRARDKVLLVRRETATDPECPTPRRFPSTLVSGKGYEDYHAYELTETEELRSELPVLETFHIRYRRGGRCIGSTNDLRKENGITNRSQFSFDTRIVDTGPGTGVRVSLFGGRRAYAQPPGVLRRQTEIKHYRTVNGVQCLRFEVLASGDERNFLRVNDLEARRDPPSTRRIGEFRLDQ